MAGYGPQIHAQHGGAGGTARVFRHPSQPLAELCHHHVAHARLCRGYDPHDAEVLHGQHPGLLRRQRRLCLGPGARLELRRKANGVVRRSSNLPQVLNKVVEQLGLSTTAVKLADSIEASVPVDTVIIEIAVTDRDPRQAARIANAVGTELGKAAGDLTPGLGNGSEAGRMTTLSIAEVPTSPSSPNMLRNLGVGFLGVPFGALLWLFLIVLGRRRLVEPYR